MKKALIVIAVLFIALMLAGASGSEIERQVQDSMTTLKSRAQEVKAKLRDSLSSSYDAQLQKSLEELRKEPRSLKRQLAVVNLMLTRTNSVTESLQAVKKADLPSLRDRVVKGLEALSESQQENAKRFASRAKHAKGAQNERYQHLSQACQRFAKAYELRAEQYAKIPVARQLREIQSSLEYLRGVREVLISLRDGIIPIVNDESALQELMHLSVTIDGIEKSIRIFSEVVLAGALGEDDVHVDATVP